MTIQELKENILANKESFTEFLKAHFDFVNADLLDNGVLNLNDETVKTNDVCDEFITIIMHSCAELEDFIFISLNNSDDNDKQYKWNNIDIWAHQYVDDSW